MFCVRQEASLCDILCVLCPTGGQPVTLPVLSDRREACNIACSVSDRRPACNIACSVRQEGGLVWDKKVQGLVLGCVLRQFAALSAMVTMGIAPIKVHCYYYLLFTWCRSCRPACVTFPVFCVGQEGDLV